MSDVSKRPRIAKFEPYTFTGEAWEAEALGLFSQQWLEHRGREITAYKALAEELAERPPSHIEIGSHRGAFLVGLGRSNPDELVLGMEIRARYHRLAGEYLKKHGVENAKLFKGDAKLATILAVPLESLDAVYVNFPDPWWKARQANRRLLDVPFLRVLARRLKPRGRLYLKSDVFEYLWAVRRFAEESKAFRPLAPERWPDERQWTLSEREAKCMRGAIPFGRGYYERLRDFDASLPTEPERWEASHWDDMLIGVDEIRGRPPVDRDTRRRTAAAARARATDASDTALDEASEHDDAFDDAHEHDEAPEHDES